MQRKRQPKKNARRMATHSKTKPHRKNSTENRVAARFVQEEGGPTPTFGFPPLP